MKPATFSPSFQAPHRFFDRHIGEQDFMSSTRLFPTLECRAVHTLMLLVASVGCTRSRPDPGATVDHRAAPAPRVSPLPEDEPAACGNGACEPELGEHCNCDPERVATCAGMCLDCCDTNRVTRDPDIPAVVTIDVPGTSLKLRSLATAAQHGRRDIGVFNQSTFVPCFYDASLIPIDVSGAYHDGRMAVCATQAETTTYPRTDVGLRVYCRIYVEAEGTCGSEFVLERNPVATVASACATAAGFTVLFDLGYGGAPHQEILEWAPTSAWQARELSFRVTTCADLPGSPCTLPCHQGEGAIDAGGDCSGGNLTYLCDDGNSETYDYCTGLPGDAACGHTRDGVASCGDAQCNGTETVVTCALDCHCGDNGCDQEFREDCKSCPGDCGACAPSCGDGQCQPGETCEACGRDCCPPSCGDSRCDSPNETCLGCPSDCGPCQAQCGDGICFTAGGETDSNCRADCACGNDVCDADETTESCAVDCR